MKADVGVYCGFHIYIDSDRKNKHFCQFEQLTLVFGPARKERGLDPLKKETTVVCYQLFM